MKKQTGIWIDSSVAYIIDIGEESPLVTAIHSDIEPRERIEGEGKMFTRVGSLFIDPEKRKERRFDQMLHEYLVKVKQQLADAEAVVIFGPAQTKNKLEKLLKQDNIIASHLLGVLPAAAMTKNQMIAWVKQYFRAN